MTTQYPERHTAWLNAMGVTRWQSRAMESVVASTAYVLPEHIVNADFWVVGEATLNPQTVYVLAGMLKAIGANPDLVRYSSISDGSCSQMSTGLPTWPTLQIQNLPPEALLSALNVNASTRIITLGKVMLPLNVHFKLASLEAMLVQTNLKREAWQQLRTLVQ